MKKVNFAIHHQAVVDCPECHLTHIEDLGEDDMGDGIEITCDCGCEFELDSEVEE